jgi:5-methylcytosine-specific restriction endonuclease McrBC GTP-binding regulatory subunit McrB
MNSKKIQRIINQKENIPFSTKYQAVECFRKHWNSEEENFFLMLKTSLSKAGNLLDSRGFYPKATLLFLAEKEPKEVRKMFQELFDETIESPKRMFDFLRQIRALCKKYEMNSYHNLAVVSTYLFLYNPKNYGLFQNQKLQKLAQLLEVEEIPMMGTLEAVLLYQQIRKEIVKAMQEKDYIFLENMIEYSVQKMRSNEPLNRIFYGAAGTGKTYQSVLYAVAIVEEKNVKEVKKENYDKVYLRYLQYKKEGLIDFITFHQSYGYEEFIEGIRPVIKENHAVEYQVYDGIFKKFCQREGKKKVQKMELKKDANVWKVKESCIYQNEIRLSSCGKIARSIFTEKMQMEDLVVISRDEQTITAIGMITSECDGNKRALQWLATDFVYNMVQLNENCKFSASLVGKTHLTVGDMEILLTEVLPQTKKNKVFIIDEINRGNVSKIFGELITLIEPNRRLGAEEETTVTLPYSQQLFTVPENIYLIGTMNTADYSLAILDTALRRRFFFIEMKPDYTVLDFEIEGIHIGKMLEKINQRIHVLYDDEHLIGHGYFMALLKNPTFETLAEIFKGQILILLKEYFQEDYEKIQLVLGDHHKKEPFRFIKKINFEDFENYSINQEAVYRIEAYEQI